MTPEEAMAQVTRLETARASLDQAMRYRPSNAGERSTWRQNLAQLRTYIEHGAPTPTA